MPRSELEQAEHEPRCWGCKNSQAGCECEGGFVPLVVNPPNETLPFCGGSGYGPAEPFEDSKRFSEVMPRPCCNCDKFWDCTNDERLLGTCPHCGATGFS